LKHRLLKRFIAETEGLYGVFLARANAYLERRIAEDDPGAGV